MCFNKLADTLTIIPDVSIWSIYYMMRDAMNKVHYDAAFTVQKCVKESENYDTANLQSILAATMKKMILLTLSTVSTVSYGASADIKRLPAESH